MNHIFLVYQIGFKPKAIKDLQDITPKMRERIWAALEKLQNNLSGDVKRLTDFTPEYRLRIGNYTKKIGFIESLFCLNQNLQN